jgi:hypothetical protein
MTMENVADLFQLSRRVESVVSAIRRFESEAKRIHPTPPAPAVYQTQRSLTGKSLFDALSALRPNIVEVPLRDALRNHVAWLVDRRVGQDLDRRRFERLTQPYDLPGEGRASVPDRLRALLAATSETVAASILAAMEPASDELAAIELERADLEVEVYRRLGFAEPVVSCLGLAKSNLRAEASMVLDRTETLAADLFARSRRRRESRMPSIIDWLDLAQARSSVASWPRQVRPVWIGEVLPDLVPRGAQAATLSHAPKGASSFLSVLGRVGRAHRQAAPLAVGVPFALAVDPWSQSEHMFGLTVASIVATAPFLTRALDVSRNVVKDEQRVLTIAAFFELRRHAACVLRTGDADDAHLFDRVFGTSLAPSLATLLLARDGSQLTRLAAWPAAATFTAGLVSSFDEDWFRNPRGVRAFGEAAARPAFDGTDPSALSDDDRGPAWSALLRRFEEILA